jgi:hypothetical protein
MRSALIFSLSIVSILGCKKSNDIQNNADVLVGYGDFQGTRLTENQIVTLLRNVGIPESQLGTAVCVAYFESNFYTNAQHDNRFDRQPVANGPKSASGSPLQYTFRAKPQCLKNPNDTKLINKVCTTMKNDNLKGYKNTPDFQQCMNEIRTGMTSAAEQMALNTPEAKLKARDCSYDYGLFEINDYWGVYGTNAQSAPMPCAHLKGKDMFELTNNIDCMKRLARCTQTSCNFQPWHGYTANKEKCDNYTLGSGLE